jgi:uncharacterized protein (TIGR00369 family)
MKEDTALRTAYEKDAGGPGVFQTTQAVEHARCIVCGSDNPAGLKLEFLPRGRGTVSASFSCHHSLQGYAGLLHGGIISALLDGAMTNCLFSVGISAVTAELSVRYLAPVQVDHPAEITATLEKSRGPLHCLHAELRQNGRVLVHASGKFMDKRRARCNQADRSEP